MLVAAPVPWIAMNPTAEPEENPGEIAEAPSSRLASNVRALLRQEDFAAADALVESALTATPTDADAWYLRGVIANRRRDHGTAITALLRSIGIRPQSALAWLALGNAYARADRLPEAMDAYRAVIAREGGWADAHFNLGLVLARVDDRQAAARAFHAAWCRDPMLFDAAKRCVATIADCIRRDELTLAMAPAGSDPPRQSFTIVLCSIDDAKLDRAVALYRRRFAGTPHEIVPIRNPRSLGEAYNYAAAHSTADVVVFSHDDIDLPAPDFASRLSRRMDRFDAVGIVGSTRLDGPAVGWSGHPHLRGWVTHRAPGECFWQVDVLDPRPSVGGIVLLDGVLLAARREVVTSVPFDAATFDGFHLYDLDWSFRAATSGFRLGVAGDLCVEHESRGNYGDTWQGHAERFCAKHDTGRTPARFSSFFGATLDSGDQVRAFYAFLGQLWERHADESPAQGASA